MCLIFLECNMNMKIGFYIIPFLAAVNVVSAGNYEIDAREIAGGQYTVSIVRHLKDRTETVEVPVTPGIINKGKLNDSTLAPGKSMMFVQKNGALTAGTLLPQAYYPSLDKNGDLRVKMSSGPDGLGAIVRDLK